MDNEKTRLVRVFSFPAANSAYYRVNHFSDGGSVSLNDYNWTIADEAPANCQQ
jgi:hypothetical protein